MSDDRISVRVEPALRKKLGRIARRFGKSESELVRDVLSEFCQRDSGQSAYDLAKRAGIIGMIKDAPPDLSTNPKYMEGFGRD